MAALNEFSQRVLSELEELKVENAIAMLNTIIAPEGSESEVEQLKGALRELVNAGLVEMGIEQFHSRKEVVLEVDEGLSMIDRLPEVFTFDSEEKLWDLRDGNMLRDPYPIILATPEGVEAGFRILSERGYQWWKAGSTGSS